MNLTVNQLAGQLISSYAKVGGINHVDGKNLPSKSAIASITVDLLFLLFPGFFEEKSIHSHAIKKKTLVLVESVFKRLQGKFTRVWNIREARRIKIAVMKRINWRWNF